MAAAHLRETKVFRITLPCSGKFTSEVDVEVFINISGFVPVDEAPPSLAANFSPGAASDEDSAEAGSAADMDAEASAVAASAVAATPGGAGDGDESGGREISASGGSAADQMQSDQAQDSTVAAAASEKQPQLRQVSHTLAIKRKKICTMQPVLVHPNIHPATQPTQKPILAPAQSQPSSGSSSSANINNYNYRLAHSQQSADQAVSFLKSISALCAFGWFCWGGNEIPCWPQQHQEEHMTSTCFFILHGHRRGDADDASAAAKLNGKLFGWPWAR